MNLKKKSMQTKVSKSYHFRLFFTIFHNSQLPWKCLNFMILFMDRFGDLCRSQGFYLNQPQLTVLNDLSEMPHTWQPFSLCKPQQTGKPQYILNIRTISSQCLFSTLLIRFKLVYGRYGQTNMHSTLDFCSRLARMETNAPLHKKS